jgi:anti-anti-sigma factor
MTPAGGILRNGDPFPGSSVFEQNKDIFYCNLIAISLFYKTCGILGGICPPFLWHQIPTDYTVYRKKDFRMKLKSTSASNGEIVILEPKGSLVGGEETDELRSEVNKLIEKGNKKLIIDLSKVTYMNSTAIGTLVAAHTSYANRQGKLILCNVGKNITNVFVVTKLSMIFQVEKDQSEAVLALT